MNSYMILSLALCFAATCSVQSVTLLPQFTQLNQAFLYYQHNSEACQANMTAKYLPTILSFGLGYQKYLGQHVYGWIKEVVRANAT